MGDDGDDDDDDDDDTLFMAPYLVRTRRDYTDAGIHHFQQPHTHTLRSLPLPTPLRVFWIQILCEHPSLPPPRSAPPTPPQPPAHPPPSPRQPPRLPRPLDFSGLKSYAGAPPTPPLTPLRYFRIQILWGLLPAPLPPPPLLPRLRFVRIQILCGHPPPPPPSHAP